MRTRVLLNLEGKHRFVGLLSADRIGALFQYAPEFVAEGLEVSPLRARYGHRSFAAFLDS